MLYFYLPFQLVFLPFAYKMDLWRWRLFTGSLDESNMNNEWWKLSKELQGIDAPVPRPADAFDPGSKYHIAANVPYIRLEIFNSHIFFSLFSHLNYFF